MCVPIGAIVTYVRYRQVAEHLPEGSVNWDRLNKAALIIGLLAAFAITIVANFPVCKAMINSSDVFYIGNSNHLLQQ